MECFSVYADEIEGRLDADYYFFIKKNKLQSKYRLVKIKEFCEVKDGDHNKLPPQFITNEREGCRYLRAQDLEDGEILSLDPIYITKDYFERIPRSHIKPGYFLFSIMASVGSAAVVPNKFNI